MSGYSLKHMRTRLVGSVAVLTLTTGTALADNGTLSDQTKSQPSARAENVLFAQSTTTAPATTPQAAEPAPSNPTGVEQVVVSASRISIAGYSQPTPVTVVGAAALEGAAKADIGDTIRELPAVGISSSPLKGGGGNTVFNPIAGLSTVNLRNLGIVRTLVLFDGQRVVSSNVSGGVDLGTIPSTLVNRIDVVTGGASAAWGSDAVAGVVNLVFNKTFTGFKADLQASDTWQDNRRAYGLDASYGFDVDGGRGHIILSGAYHNSPDSVFIGSAKWWKSTYLLQNPAYTPTNGAVQYLHYTNVGQRATQGGAILTGPLAGTQFVGPHGTPVPYNPGVFTGTLAAGGSSNPWNSEIPTNPLSYPYRTTTLFGYGTYRLTPEIAASVQLNFGHQWSKNDSTTALTQTMLIHDDNAYLDPSIVARMGQLGVNSFNLATTSTNNVDMRNPSYNAFQNSIGIPVNVVNRQLLRGVFSLDGALGDNWSWNAYYQHGGVRVRSTPTHTVINDNMTRAVDAVRVTAANVGTSGLAVGSIACRSTLSDPTNGCQPLNVFGEGVASAAAINYVNTDQNYQTMVLDEDVFSASMQGVLPWNLTGAGQLSVAFGGEYRKEAGRADISPLAQAKALNVGNFGALLGHYSVQEGFLETDVPLIKDGIVQSLSLNAAGRLTSYSTSGLVETWKLGTTSQINDDIKLRATWSYDIRAPNLSELFNQGLVSQATPIDPRTGQAVVAYTNQSGNPDLKPEKAVTISGGIVLTPHWVEGLQVSLDWYSINVKGFITTPSSRQESEFCMAGQQFYCNQFVYDSNGKLQFENLMPQNAAWLKTSGLDFQADYLMDFLSGSLAWHFLGNYTDQMTTAAFGQAAVDYAGQLGSFTSNTSMPKFRANLSATYSAGPWRGTVQGRFLGSARLNNQWTSGVQVDDNAVPGVAYLDLRGSYDWNENIQLYAAMDNVTNVPPPVVATLGSQSNVSLDINTAAGVYDILGRTMRAGVRFNF
ncbi:MAG: TonB-dependent receptor [Alphaproteobacteria bacterium]|nr:TonB-dependent receptor [Alphaproteobacteria bacterium]